MNKYTEASFFKIIRYNDLAFYLNANLKDVQDVKEGRESRNKAILETIRANKDVTDLVLHRKIEKSIKDAKKDKFQRTIYRLYEHWIDIRDLCLFCNVDRYTLMECIKGNLSNEDVRDALHMLDFHPFDLKMMVERHAVALETRYNNRPKCRLCFEEGRLRKANKLNLCDAHTLSEEIEVK